MATADAWMPLYIGDYLGDTMHLEAAEHGAYLLLLMHYWRNGPLPDDDRALAGIARVDRKTWLADTGPIVRKFFSARGGRLHQQRMDVERERASGISEKRREAARAKHAKKAAESPPSDEDAPASGARGRCNAAASADANAPASAHTHARASQSQSQSPDTVAEATDAAVPAAPADALWREGLPILASLTGKAPAGCRALLGKLRKEAREDCGQVLALLREAASLKPAEPVAWLTAAARVHGGPAQPAHDLLTGTKPVDLRKAWPGVERFVTDPLGVEHPEVAGWHLDEVADLVCEAARIDRARWRGDWRPLIGWLNEGLEPHRHILPAIRRVAERTGYQPPGSLTYFDRPVHERRAA